MSNKTIKNILLVEDNPGDARLLSEMFREQGASNTKLAHVTSMMEAEKHLAANGVDVIILDLGLPDTQGIGGIKRAQAAAPGVPLVVLTGLDDQVFAKQALREGAQDYLIKGQIETRGLLRALRYAVERKRLDQLKSEFVATVSHELRTPLTSISGSLGLLISKAPDDLPRSMLRLISIAHTNSQRLVRLVNDILDIEKMESGQVVFDFRRVEIRALVEQAIEANRGFAEGHGVRLRMEESGAVSAVRADADRLLQVITNLLSNAIKFSPENNEVAVTLTNAGRFVRLSVRDHGSGISDEFKEHIFEKFAQADTKNTRKMGGTGLGLSIVKEIVDRLGGMVDYADAPGGGTIFHVEVPCWHGAAQPEAESRAQPDVLRILLCDEDLDTAVTLRQQLNEGGSATQRSAVEADVKDAPSVQASGIPLEPGPETIRARILYVCADSIVAKALCEIGDVVSVGSMESASRTSRLFDFDLAVLDAAQSKGIGAPLFLRNKSGSKIPVVEFDSGASGLPAETGQTRTPKLCGSIEELLETARLRLATRPQLLSRETA